MKLEIRNCGLAAILAVVLFSISVGYFLNSGQAAYTPANPVIASWDLATDVPKNISVNGTWRITSGAAYPTGKILHAATAAANNAIRWSVTFPDTAPHTLYVRTVPDTGSGIVTVSINGINQSTTMDLYSATDDYEVIFTVPITPVRVGKNTLQFWVASKNPSSSNYDSKFTDWWII